MQKETNDIPDLMGQESNHDGNNLPGYPAYPENEDIYNNNRKEENINPEDLLKKKGTTGKYKIGGTPEKELYNQLSGDDLDIPGAEMDDEMEEIGGEDEENNYYSLGGDDHDDLEEDQGDETV